MRLAFFYLMLLFLPAFSLAVNVDSLKQALSKETSIDKKADLYYQICENSEGPALLKIATEFFNYSQKNNYDRGIALASDNLGYYYQQNKPDSGIYFYKFALNYYLKEKNNKKISLFYNQLGVCYYIKGNLNASLDNYIKALAYEDDKKGYALNNIAQIYGKLGNEAKAMGAYNEALDYFGNKKDTLMLATTNQNIGMLYTEKKDFEQAEKYLTLALNMVRENSKAYSQILANLGINYTLKGDPEKGKIYLQKAATLLRKENNLRGLAYVLTNIGTTYSKLGKNYEAIKYATEGYELSLKLGFLENIEKTSKMLASVYENMGDHKNTLKYTRIYFRIKDSIFSEKSIRQLNALNAMYESNAKDYELLKQAEKLNKNEILIQKQNLEDEKKRKYIFALAIVGLCVLFIAAFIFRAYKQKKKANEIITQQKTEVEKQKSIIETQKELVEEHRKEILDSIHYAKRIQDTLMADQNFINEHLPQNFILFQPKDIVSGDFYWAAKKGDKFYLAICDSTGHGVPGAFMSLLNIGFLSEAVNEKGIEQPNEIFNFVRQRLTTTISKEGQRDGFDGILVCYDQRTKTLSYSAANNSPVLFKNNSINELESDRMPVGVGERNEDFKLYNADIKKGDTLYLYTDGYADQFGGPKGKKFKYKQLNELLLANAGFHLKEQHDILHTTFKKWRGELEQVDDVCIIGIKF